MLFHGFSRGSANSYAMAALDNASGNRYFSMVISNAGIAAAAYPPNMEISAGSFGLLPFKGIQWAMYCGAKDPDPTINGCPAMRNSRDWVTKYGGEIAVFIEDQNGGHGGFHLNPSNVETVLAKFLPNNRYQDVEKVLDWAEREYPSIFAPHVNSTLGYGYYYRCYQGDLCAGAKNDELFLYQLGKISPAGAVNDYLEKTR